MFKKIKNDKINFLILVLLVFVLILVLFGVINIYKSRKIINDQTNANFIHVAKDIRESEDDYLNNAENNVERCKSLIELTIDSKKLNKIAPFVSKYNKNEIPYISNYLNSIVKPLLLRTSMHTNGIMSIFFDFDHNLLVHKDVIGVWYTTPNSKGNFKLTDNGLRKTMFPETRTDLEWYYLPKKNKKGVWSKPYVDNDLKIDMITYSSPVYIGKTFLGIIGVDISMEKIKDFICKIKLYDTGKVYLLGKDNKIIFAKDYKPSTSPEVIDKNLYTFLTKLSAKNSIQLQGEEVKLIKSSSSKNLFAITKLYNGFILVLDVPIKELYAETNTLIAFTVYSLILAILFSLLVAIEAYTKIKKINDDLMHKEKLISMGTMAAEVAHEINNPLGYISCNIDTLKKFLEKIRSFMLSCETEINKVLAKEIPLEKGIEYIETLKIGFKIDYVLESLDELIEESKEGIKRVSETVIHLKDFAKNDTNYAKTSESLEKIIDNALAILDNKISQCIDVTRNFKDIPPLLCNKNQIEQVLINILDNACYSLEKKGPKDKKIIISTYKKLKNAYIEIEDNGIGIDKNKINRVFDAFFTTKMQGTGLGLSISKEIITKKHNGEILVESKKGKGTKFTIKIPY